jgi:hypothetical protein
MGFFFQPYASAPEGALLPRIIPNQYELLIRRTGFYLADIYFFSIG